MKLWMMVKSSIKKNRSSSITLALLIVIATIFLNIGLNVVTGLSSFIDEKNDSLNGADFVMVAKSFCKDQAIQILQEMEGYEDLESESAILYEPASIQNKEVEQKPQNMGLLFLNMNTEREYSRLNLLEEGEEKKENSIILPYSLKTGSGYEVGDEVEVKLNGAMYTFEIYAFAEDVIFATPMNISIYKCFLTESAFQKLYQEAGEMNQQIYINVRLEEGYSGDDYDQEFTNVCSTYEAKDLIGGIALNYETMKVATTATVAILMAILVIFAVLIIIISMVVIRFSIVNYIEEDIKNLGSMEAIGFTSRMIQSGLIAQFLFVTMVGFVLGTVISLLSTKVISNFVGTSLGLNWNQGLTVSTMLMTFAILIVLILGVTYKVSRRLNHVTPIMALRNGIENYHFDKNYLPFETTPGNLHWLLGMKGLLHSRKQNISIGVIGTLMAFCMIFVLGLYHSFVVSRTPLLNIIGIERPQISVMDYGEDYLEFFDELAKTQGVRKTLRYQDRNISIRNKDYETSTVMRICSDFSFTETNILAEGRYPEYENEIALSYVTSKALHAKLGDVVSVISGNSTYEFVVVGLVQHITYLGSSASITEAGMLRCEPSFQLNQLYLYLNDDVQTDDVISEIEDEIYARGGTVRNMEESIETMLATFYQGITLLCIVVCIITGIVTALILYYLVKVKITKERVNLGIQKAIGFTSGQLMLHTVLSFVPVIGLSAILGTVLALLLVDPLCALVLNSMASIHNCKIDMNPAMVLGAILFLLIIATITTALVSWRIRKLEVRDLVME